MDYLWSIFGFSSTNGDLLDYYEIWERLPIPYLKAIQALPGDTNSEKQKWLMKLVSNRQQDSGDITQIPAVLQPLLQVEIAVREKKHEDIASALKSEDRTVVNRAFKATWFFDGSHKDVVDVAYFSDLFRYVSLNTRIKIVKTLSYRLADNGDTKFAMEMFELVELLFGIYQACPLIIACDSEFILSMEKMDNFILPFRIVAKIFNKHPDVIIHFLKNCDFDDTKHCNIITVDTYKFLMPKILKQKPTEFVALYEKIQIPFHMSNTCISLLLKKHKQWVQNKPLLYVNRIIPSQKINAELMEQIFYFLFPDNIHDFKTDNFLFYLSRSPQEKRYKFLSEAYMRKYEMELLSDTINITPTLLMLLPDKERIEQAKRLLKEKESEGCQKYAAYNCEYDWNCYLPTDKMIPFYKHKLSKASQLTDRVVYIQQMILNCKINKNNDELLSILKYFLERHKNEQFIVFEDLMKHFVQTYQLIDLNQEHVSVLNDIVQSFYVRCRQTSMEMVEALLHFYFLHDKPDNVAKLIDMLLDIYDKNGYVKLNFLTKHPQYERAYLKSYLKQMQKRYSYSNRQQQKKELSMVKIRKDALDEERVRTLLFRLVMAMHDFNKRHKQLIARKELKAMILNDHVWLKNAVSSALPYENKRDYTVKILFKLEKALCESIFSMSDMIRVDVTTNAISRCLKQNPKSILDDWEYYLKQCEKYWYNWYVQRFIKNIRWYTDIPIKFIESCVDKLLNYQKENQEKEYQKPYVKPVLVILTLLLQGDPLMKVIDPFVPSTKTVDIKQSGAATNFEIVKNLLWSIQFSNPPISLDFILKLCEGDYLQLVLTPLINLCRRSSLPKVMAFTKQLVEMRVSVRKHGIRLMKMIATKHEFNEFFSEIWSTEKNCTLREVLFHIFRKHFFKEPNKITWSMFSTTMTTIRLEEDSILLQLQLYPTFPKKYIGNYFEIWLAKIQNLQRMGLEKNKVITCTVNYLKSFDKFVFTSLPDEFLEKVLSEYVFHKDAIIRNAAKNFAILYLLTSKGTSMDIRLPAFKDVYKHMVAEHWDKTDPKRNNFYPFRHSACELLEELAIQYSREQSSYSPLICNYLIDIFSSTLSPTMNAYVYLLLIYARIFNGDRKRFGMNVGLYMPQLIKIFSSQFIPIMSKVLVFFIEEVFKTVQESILDQKVSIAMGLIEADKESEDKYSINGRLMATGMISSINTKCERHVPLQYYEIIKELQENNNPVIQSLLNAHLCDCNMFR